MSLTDEQLLQSRLMAFKILKHIDEELDPARKLNNAQMMVVASIVTASVLATSPRERRESALELMTTLTRAALTNLIDHNEHEISEREIP
jgi:hypothetical protein